jgi:hypothetical protein
VTTATGTQDSTKRDPAMRVLIAWDDPTEAELLRLYVGAGDN